MQVVLHPDENLNSFLSWVFIRVQDFLYLIKSNQRKKFEIMSHEIYGKNLDVVVDGGLSAVVSELSYFAPTTDEWGDELPYPNLRGCDNVEKEVIVNPRNHQPLDTVADDYMEKHDEYPENGSFVFIRKKPGYLAYTLKMNDCNPDGNLSRYYPLMFHGHDFDNLKAFKRYLKETTSMLYPGELVLGYNGEVVGTLVYKEQRFYQKHPARLPKKYRFCERYQEVYIENDCHC